MAKAKAKLTTEEALALVVNAIMEVATEHELDLAVVFESVAGEAGESDEDGDDEGGEEGEISEEEVHELLDNMEDIAEIKAIAEALGIKAGPKDKTVEALAKKIKAKDLADIIAALEELGYFSEESDIDVEEILSGLELAELKAIAKAVEVKFGIKDKAEAIVAKIVESADADALIEALTEAGHIEGEEGDDEGGEEEPEEILSTFLNGLELAKIKQIAKELEIGLDKKDTKVEAIATKIIEGFESAQDVIEWLDGEGYLS